jgi:hypothetical protein
MSRIQMTKQNKRSSRRWVKMKAIREMARFAQHTKLRMNKIMLHTRNNKTRKRESYMVDVESSRIQDLRYPE